MKKLTIAAVALLALASLAMAETFTIDYQPVSGQLGTVSATSGGDYLKGDPTVALGGNMAITASGTTGSRTRLSNWADGSFDISFTIADGYELTAGSLSANMAASGVQCPNLVAWELAGTKVDSSAKFETVNTAVDLTASWSGLSATGAQTLSGMRSANATNMNGGSGAQNGTLNINSLSFTGTVQQSTQIPEPATLSLLGLGALAMVLRRKLRK
jgi:hypothetical protein